MSISIKKINKKKLIEVLIMNNCIAFSLLLWIVVYRKRKLTVGKNNVNSRSDDKSKVQQKI